MLRRLLFMARLDLAQLLRERETLLWVFVMPILFFYFIGTTAGGGRKPDAERRDSLALVTSGPGGFLLDELVRRLEERGFQVTLLAPDADLEAYPRRLNVPAPAPGHASFTAGVLAGQRAVLRLHLQGESAGARFAHVRVARAVYTVLADLVVLKQSGSQVSAAALDELARQPRPLTLEVRSAGRRRVAPDGFEQAIPGTMVMFTLLVLLTGGAIPLVIERELGLLRRLVSTPIPRSAVVWGKWAGRMALGIVQLAVAMATGTLLFGMDWGPSLPMIVLVLLAWGGCCASLAILLANVARSRAQMAGLGIMVTMLLASLGGCWWPIEVTPEWMQRLALFLPTGWAMDALHRLISFREGAAAALPHTLALAAGSAVLGALAVRTFRYQ